MCLTNKSQEPSQTGSTVNHLRSPPQCNKILVKTTLQRCFVALIQSCQNRYNRFHGDRNELSFPTLQPSLHYLNLRKCVLMTIFVLSFRVEKYEMIYGDSKLAESFGVASANFEGVIKPLSHFMVSCYVSRIYQTNYGFIIFSGDMARDQRNEME